MKIQEIIDKTEEEAGEWLEMSHDPKQTMINILSAKIIKLNDHIEYLERRLENVNYNRI